MLLIMKSSDEYPSVEWSGHVGEGVASYLSSEIGEGQQQCDPAVALEQLNIELGRIRETRADSALCRARAMDTELFDDTHKMEFLHTENYIANAAAQRILAYWETRADLFGDDSWLLPMNKSRSLREEDACVLHRGLFQILPQKDLNGRALIFYDPSRYDKKLCITNESMLRVLWYIMHVAMEDRMTREKGFVLIVYPKKVTPEQIHRDFIARGIAIIGSCLPLPWKGFHICHPCDYYNDYFPLIKMLSPKRMKNNILVHFGADEFVLECLAGHGIPADRLPEEIGGREGLDYSNWISLRKQAEGGDALRVPTPQPPAAAADDEPESSDVVREDSPPKKPQHSVDAGKDSGVLGIGFASAASSDAVLEDMRKKPQHLVPAAALPGTTNAFPSIAPSAVKAMPSLAKSSGTAKAIRPGRKGDDRMHKAVTIKMKNNEMSLVEALQEGGFTFEGLNDGIKGRPHHEVFDQNGVSLMQRKNQLLRRIRIEKKKKAKVDD